MVWTEKREVAFGAASDAAAGQLYPDNAIKTSKYTLLTFLPLVIAEQFQKRANVYFLIISVLMAIGEYTDLFETAVSPWSTVGVLIPMMAASAFLAAIDDVRRHGADSRTNAQQARVIRMGGRHKVFLDTVRWQDIRVGDILVLKGEEEVPADLVPLASSGFEGRCYVSTANLDGETNLKIKTAAPSAQAALCGRELLQDPPLLDQAVERLSQLKGTVQAEAPSKSILHFTGSIELSSDSEPSERSAEEPLNAVNLLLRGTQLRNTAWLFGVAVYTGPHTRMVMNSRATPVKLANLERVVNRAMLIVLGAQAVLALLSAILSVSFAREHDQLWYLHPPGLEKPKMRLPALLAEFLKFFVLYSNLMPISLYAAMEICNFAQAYFLKSDLGMYDEDQDTPASVRSTNLCHELGQVCHIFSDKTGTLTQNVMELKRISVAGKVFGTVDEARGFSGAQDLASWQKSSAQARRSAEAFLELLAVAHTVMITSDSRGAKRFEAESPDEEALVKAASELGWSFQSRSGDLIHVQVGLPGESGDSGNRSSYRVLALNSFNSTRKRMSLVVQAPDGQHWLLAKGADNVMMDRAAHVPDWLPLGLNEFAKEGLRTLVLGRRQLQQAEVHSWQQDYEAAQNSLEDRGAQLDAVAEKIEVNLQIVGVTAIEDKLQVGASETILALRHAGIKLWVLTGDKLETARNIGYSTNLLSDTMEVLVLKSSQSGTIGALLHELQEPVQKATDEGKTVALMVTGDALEEVTAAGQEKDFLKITENCRVVIACRVSPLQKAQLVRLVRESVEPQPVTLAIGDGANDVPMIQEAQVGVGISGKEGRQAVNAADFAIAQFSFLQRLLLVHGRWDYKRTCKFILYTFWKNAIITLLLFYYTFFSGFSGTCMFTSAVWTSFNLILFFPIIATGVFDRDVTAKQAMKLPGLYETGRLGVDLNLVKMIEMLLSALVHSFVLMTVAVVAVGDVDVAATGNYYSFGFMVFTWLIITMNYRAVFITTTYNWVFVAGILSSLALYVLFLLVYCNLPSIFPEVYHTMNQVLVTPLFWIGSLTVPLLAMMIDMFKAYLVLEFLPNRGDLILERSVLGCAHSGLLIHDGRCEAEQDLAVARNTNRAPTQHLPSSFDYDWVEGDHMRLQHASSAAVTDTSLLDTLSSQHSTPARSTTQGTLLTESTLEDGRLDSDGCVIEHRPPDSQFAQQKLKSCQFVLTWRAVLAAALGTGGLLLLLGVVMTLHSSGVAQIRVEYDRGDKAESDLSEELQPTWCPVAPGGGTNSCLFDLRIPNDMEPPIQVFYSVNPFMQNYFPYMSSMPVNQLEGRRSSREEIEDQCPVGTRVTSTGKQIYPCGLVATSVFNDTFEIFQAPIDTESPDMTIYREFHNPPDYLQRPGVSWLYERYPTVTTKSLGVRSKRFIAWMIPNFFGRAAKPYGVISKRLQKGQVVTLRINASFPVQSLGARKMLLLTTSNLLGARNYFLANILLTSGCLSLGIAAVVLAIRLCCARKLGKPRQHLAYLNGVDEDSDSEDSSNDELGTTTSSEESA
eukprot:TRINITY_DN28922_c0_g1_i1.p1 TRINITY_DN28922_c0_g1~~TRINITY_DN28922_c0_g1_i1.p1  ORF type:complete len:1537 (-),score=281.76 TRINITY_DN28922_c0_g1_i1:177-4787(-)